MAVLHVVATAHGTDNPRGRELVNGLRAQVAALLAPGIGDFAQVVVHEAYVDVQEPALESVLAALPAGEAAVVAPLLLSHGFHTGVDIADAVAAREHTLAAAPLGPHPLLIAQLADRLGAAGLEAGDAVVLAAAGTRIEAGQQQAREAAAALAERLGRPVGTAFCSAAQPSVADAVAAARRDHPHARVAVASYLLAPGFFQNRVAQAGADFVTEPLLPGVTIAECVVARLAEVLTHFAT
ncbi:hypothetical protein GCM10023081_24860 [Arthrobacter ginkgonis]|uniref:Sirohydrochlorin ferrochelatase n=1 Tax=Arthrobacter ginkgonis TaxID=1630594 RepID=A0ABP7CFT8_9MICC